MRPKKNTETIMADNIFENIGDCLSTEKSYVVKDFGTFGVEKRATRNMLFFKPDKKLKEKIK